MTMSVTSSRRKRNRKKTKVSDFMAVNDWAGYLFATIDGNGTIIKKFPDKYIKLDSYEVTPDQREEVKAYRDDYTRDLHRVTATGKKNKIAFITRADLHLAEVNEIDTFFTASETSALERKVRLKYWNQEEYVYKTGYFYRPNKPYKMKKISDTDIQFDEIGYELIEY